jgi:hypothetical protein
MSLIKPVRAIQLDKSHPLAHKLAACWLFNEGCGSLAADISGHGLNIPFAGGTPQWASGNHGSALYFNNTENEYLEIDIAPVINMPCTILAWICPDNVTNGNYYYPVYIADKDVINQAWGLLLNYGTGNVTLTANILVSGYATAAKSLTAGKWHQIVGVIAGTEDRRCYVDGGNKGTNTYPVSNPSGLDRISIGRAGDSTPGYYYPGKIGCVFIWNRPLSDSEIYWLYREPYAMFETGTKTTSLSFPVTINSLAGIINAKSIITGKLNTENRTNQIEKSWLLDVLANGMTGNAIKLGTALSMGWFWMRNTGCCALYRGTNLEQIDFEHILKTAGTNEENISIPAFCEHGNSSVYFYILRHFNKSGVREQTFSAVLKISLDSNGDIETDRSNGIYSSTAEIIDNNKVRLSWFYNPIGQKSEPEYFKIYFDNGSGQIDYENSIAEIEYSRHKFYCYDSASLQNGTYLFVIRAVNVLGDENVSSEQIKVQIVNSELSSIEIIEAKNI